MSKPIRLLVRYGDTKGELPARRAEKSSSWWMFAVLGAAGFAALKWGPSLSRLLKP